MLHLERDPVRQADQADQERAEQAGGELAMLRGVRDQGRDQQSGGDA
jgi:hypothetical protein